MTADRFKWLEFEEGDGQGKKAPSSTPIPGRGLDVGKDEHWHVAEARRAFDAGEFESALRNFSAALKYKGDLEEAWAGQARCMILAGQTAQAVTWGQKGLDRLATSTLMASTFAYVLARSGHPEQALNLSDQILSRGTESANPGFWLDRGVCLLEGGQHDSAGACFDKAMAAAHGDPDWLQRVGQEYLLSKEPARALAVLNKALERRTDRAFLWVLTGRAALALNLGDRAQQAFEQALALEPGNREASAACAQLRKATASRPCWIATLVFAGHDARVVEALRAWRDEAWLPTLHGRVAAWLYHVTAPLVCLMLVRLAFLHAPLRRVLTILVSRVHPIDSATTTARTIEVRAEPERLRLKEIHRR